jgi:aminopeptidase
VRDHRAEALARILVRYSTRIGEGDVCVIQSTTAAEVLVQAVYEEVLRAGGLPIMQMTTDGALSAFYELASDTQLDWIPPTSEWAAENSDARIAIMADVNPRELSKTDPKKQARVSRARQPLMETSMRRSAAGEHRWALTLFPNHAYASEAGMSLRESEDFYYAACLADDGDPVTAWERQADEVKRLAEWIEGKEEVHVTGPGTDITLGVAGRHWIPCYGEHNMPDGEFFTGPVEDAVNGEVTFSFPASYGGRTVSGVRMRFEDGRVVDASAEQGLPDRDARHRRGRAHPRRARHRHQLRDRHRDQGDPARREDRRDRPHGDRHELSRERRLEQLGRPLGHGLRPTRRRSARGRRGRSAARRQVRGLRDERQLSRRGLSSFCRYAEESRQGALGPVLTPAACGPACSPAGAGRPG